jgi:hypothetical protein
MSGSLADLLEVHSFGPRAANCDFGDDMALGLRRRERKIEPRLCRRLRQGNVLPVRFTIKCA